MNQSEVSPVLSRTPPSGNGVSAQDRADFLELIRDLLREGQDDLYDKVLKQMERLLFTEVLSHTHGHQAHASELLGLNRTTLRYKLRMLGLTVDKVIMTESRHETAAQDQG